MTHGKQSRKRWMALGWASLAVSLGLTGCTGEYGGQNLPSGYYLSQQVQYYPPGPQFKLSQEAAAQKAYRDTEAERTPPQH
jgi:hypothetical protein